MSEIREPESTSKSTGLSVVGFIMFIGLATMAIIYFITVQGLTGDLKVANNKNQQLEITVKDMQKQLDSATGKDISSASLIVGQDEVVKTPLGRLRVSAHFLKPVSQYDARIAVTAKFLDRGGYTWDLPTDGTWASHDEGWQVQIAPEGYSVGYEWNYDKDGNATTLNHSDQYYTLLWRPEPTNDFDWTFSDQAIQKQMSIEASSH